MTIVAGARSAEQTRARYPDEEGYAERDGVSVFWERYGDGEPTVLFLPTWSIIHSRTWKAQVPYLSRHCRVVTFDGRGNGKSDRPEGPDAYAECVLVKLTSSIGRSAGFESAGSRSLIVADVWAGKQSPRFIVAAWQAPCGRSNILAAPIAGCVTPRQGSRIQASVPAVSAARFAGSRSTRGLATMISSAGKSSRRSRPSLGKGGGDHIQRRARSAD